MTSTNEDSTKISIPKKYYEVKLNSKSCQFGFTAKVYRIISYADYHIFTY